MPRLLTHIILILWVLSRNAGSVDRCLVGTEGAPAQLSFSPGAELGPAISPDGGRIAFEYFHPDAPNLPQIWVMDRRQGFKSARPIVDNVNYNSWPSWSPDGQWLSLVSKAEGRTRALTSQIYKVRVADGTLVQLTHFPEETDLGDSTSWSPDGRIAFEYDDDIYVVSESGGTPAKLVDLRSVLAPDTLSGIEWSPDGSHLAFRGSPRGSRSKILRIWVTDSSGQQIRQLTQGPADENPSWFGNDNILFERWFLKRFEARVCAVCLKTSAVRCLTRNHVDVSPRDDPTAGVILFSRGDIPKKELKDRWVPVTHIFVLKVRLK